MFENVEFLLTKGRPQAFFTSEQVGMLKGGRGAGGRGQGRGVETKSWQTWLARFAVTPGKLFWIFTKFYQLCSKIMI